MMNFLLQVLHQEKKVRKKTAKIGRVGMKKRFKWQLDSLENLAPVSLADLIMFLLMQHWGGNTRASDRLM